MKTHLKRASMLAAGLLVGGKLFAQTPDTTAAKGDYVQPFSGDASFKTWSIGVNAGLLTPFTIFGPNGRQDFRNPTSQLGYGAYIKKQILPGFGIQADFFRGKVSGEGGQPGTFDAFETSLNYAASLSANITLANIDWMHHKSAIQPYVTAGWGMMGYKPVLNPDSGSPLAFKNNDESVTEYFIPVGLGVKIGLGSNVNLDLGYQVNFVGSDNFDGNKTGSTSDRFSYAHIGLEFALGGSKKPQLATYNPVNSMRTEYLMRDAQNKQMLQAQIDAEKANNAALRSDLDKTKADIAKLTADSDGDGVVDANDKCPGTPAGTKVDGSGCPLAKPVVVVTEEDRRVVNEAIKNLEFDFGKATIRAKSYPSLQRVAKLLVDKNFSLKLAGHTDNVGSDAANLKLSKERAESIKSYLVSQGANPSRIEATGYGESQPIATNKTAAGRQKNRRVEFTLY